MTYDFGFGGTAMTYETPIEIRGHFVIPFLEELSLENTAMPPSLDRWQVDASARFSAQRM